ncbi:MAG: aminopeptidase N [Actinobacteria bacterium]|nr:aminopeptidase N [Actinomycetota bacterium]
MPGVNISRAEAQERSKHLSVDGYLVTLDVTHGSEKFIARSEVTFSCNQKGYSTFIDAVGQKLIAASLNGKTIDASKWDGESLFLDDLDTTNHLVVEIEGEYSKNGEGLQYSLDPADGEAYLYSQGETAYIRRMYPCFDQPDLKATFTLTAIAPKHWEVISNSPVTSKIVEGEKATWSFATTPRIPTYICALIAGPYSHVHDVYQGQKRVDLGIYCRKSLASHLDPDEIFTVTKQGFDYFEKVFGLAYPFEKYDQIAVMDFNWGAMENSGAVTFREDLLVFRSKVTERMYAGRASTILHEMAHMWFGDMVTMSWWDDLWLNESFAEFASYLALVEGTRFTNGWSGFNSERKNWAYRQDQLTSTHPIVADMVDIEAVNANFDGITYAKGASVLQQLVAHVGRDNFIKGLRSYFEKHAWANTTLKDLLVELEATSGRDLDPWVSTWLQSAGVNTLRPVIEEMNGSYTSIKIAQEAPLIPEGSKELRPHRIAVGLYDIKEVAGKKVLSRRKSEEFDLAGALTEVKGLSGEKIADLLLINDRDLSYAKIRFDDRSIATLKRDLGKIDDSLARALCWSATWDMLRDAEISASDFVEIAIAGLPGEDDITIVTNVALREKVAGAFYAMLDSAKPGSDHQLQFARGAATFAFTPAQRARISEMLAGGVGGLAVDADLRWHFLTNLVEKGIATRADVDAELTRDNTVTGENAHQLCLAAFPNKEAKAEAWDLAIDGDLTNSKRVATLTGFARPLHRELLEGYVDKYFSILLDVWGRKSYEVSSKIVSVFFPAYIVEESTLTKTNGWLSGEGKDAPTILRRLVIEGRDALERALRVKSVDR